jgi:hypothetical protein
MYICFTSATEIVPKLATLLGSVSVLCFCAVIVQISLWRRASVSCCLGVMLFEWNVVPECRLRKLHNEEFHNLYSSPSIIRMIKSRRMRWAGHVARMGEKRNAYRILVWKPERNEPLGRSRRRWVDNIKMDFGWGGMDWIYLAQDMDQWRAFIWTR